MSDIMNYLIAFVAVFVMSAMCAMLREKGEFSFNTFLCSVSIGISVLIWIGVIPIYLIVVSILIIIGMLISIRTPAAT